MVIPGGVRTSVGSRDMVERERPWRTLDLKQKVEICGDFKYKLALHL